MSTRTLRFVLAVAITMVSGVSVSAQGGAGVPGCYFSHRGSVIGGYLSVDYGYPGLGTGVGVISFSDGYGPVQHPVFGLVYLDTNSTAYNIFVQLPDTNGNVHIAAPIPADPALVLAPPIYVNGFMADANLLPAPYWSLSKTISFTFETQDGYRPVGDMIEARVLHTATSLAASPAADDIRVLIAGGGTGPMFFPAPSATTELYSPLKRIFEAGPAMSVPRMKHQAVRLQDGRVLLCGGLSSGLLATAACEIFDPASSSFQATGAMTAPRFGHQATLLQDGRVLVTGGMTDWSNAGTNLVARLNTSQLTAEVYEPATGTWTAVGPMAVQRTGHTHTLMPDGRVIVIGGVNGGFIITQTWTGISGNAQVPSVTSVVEAFNPSTGTFQIQQVSFNGGTLSLAFHGASLLPNGTILVSGGFVGGSGTGGANPIDYVQTLNVASGTVTARPGIPGGIGIWLHQQVASRWNGDAIIIGGFTDAQNYLNTSPKAYRHTGTTVSQTMDCGEHALLPGGVEVPVAGFTLVPLYNDFTYLVCGGWTGTGTATASNKAFLASEQ